MMTVLHVIRALTVGMALFTTFWCLLLIASPPATQTPPGLDIVVTVSTFLLFASLIMGAGFVIGQHIAEDED